VSDLTTAIVAGTIGAVATWVLTQSGRAQVAWQEVTLHDQQAIERNEQLIAYVIDETRKLTRELQNVAEDYNSKGTLRSSNCVGDLADRKAGALHRYRDEEWRVRLQLASLKAQEGAWHAFFRWLRGRRQRLALTARATVEPFLDKWRQPIDRYGMGPVEVFDLTTRTTEDALKELPMLPLS
jgi:hypothetical protein